MIEKVSLKVLVTVCVSKQQLWQFLERFGKEFALPIVDDLGREFKLIRAVETYEDDPRTSDNAWVTVKLNSAEAQKFLSFCEHFSGGQGLTVGFYNVPVAQLARNEDAQQK